MIQAHFGGSCSVSNGFYIKLDNCRIWSPMLLPFRKRQKKFCKAPGGSCAYPVRNFTRLPAGLLMVRMPVRAR
jgi:hypothetical protein